MRYLPLATFLLLSAPAALSAQWRLALLTGTAASHGDARNATDPAHPEIHADAPATLAISLARDGGPWRVGLDMHHTSAGIAEIGGSSVITTRNALTAWGAALELAHRLAGGPGAPELLVSLGAGVDRWSFDLDASSSRWRGSAQGALEADLAISARWTAVVRGQLSAGPSIFTPEELPEGFVQQAAMRLGLVLGIARRL